MDETDLQFSTYTNGAGEWWLRVFNTRTGELRTASGRGQDALARARGALAQELRATVNTAEHYARHGRD